MNRDRRYFTAALLAAVGMSLIEPAPVMAHDIEVCTGERPRNPSIGFLIRR